LVTKAGRSAAIECARAFAQRLKAGTSSAKAALEDVSNDSFYIVDEHIGAWRAKHASHTATHGALERLMDGGLSNSRAARRVSGAVLLVGVFVALLFAATGAPAVHALCAAAVAAAAAALVATASDGVAGDSAATDIAGARCDTRRDDEEVGERTASVLRVGESHGRAVYVLSAFAAAGAISDAGMFGGVMAAATHTAGVAAFRAKRRLGEAAPTDASPAFLTVLVLLLVAS
jgi:hypothetical protein